MPDDRTYGFNKADAESLVQMIGTSDAEFAELQPSTGGGGGKKFAAKLTASLSSGTAAGTEFYSMDGMTLTYVETGTIYDPLFNFDTLISGDWLYCFKQAGKYYASDNAKCSGTSPLIDTPPESGPPGEPP